MNRVSHLGIGIGLCVFSFVCFSMGRLMFLGMAIGKDSVPGASIFDGDFITLYVVDSSLILGALWFALLSFRRAFRPPTRRPSVPPATAIQALEIHSAATPEEKLAHLVKKPNDKLLV